MTKAELIEKVQREHSALSKRQLALVVDAVFENLAKGIRKDKRFSMPGFGTFVVKRRAGRVGRDPRTGAEIQIAPTKTVGFKPAPELKKAL
ncbi:HU family DNA-binding protein [Anaeromyxobacter oryzisoli]|jgi:DNA-binding protein HU-beta|uniref:HU family DNA-binding protein n=1 Tax=Anaeromyxobacter oryzisoli TaxID=2925408 RepID=UPI001F59D717|nr:HU family DNA-binding protein [Anaeromyxobacter sp. SG63]